MTRILIVEDEESYREPLVYQLTREGYDVSAAASGEEGLELFTKGGIDLVLLDLMLPGIDGTALCRRIREQSRVPIIMLTAKSAEIDKVVGLEIGADDYVTKPFRPLELVARVKAQLRRYKRYNAAAPEDRTALTYRGLELHVKTHRCLLDGEEVLLTPTEFSILRILLENKGAVVSAEELFRRIWKDEYYSKNNNTITAHIRHLREKLKDSFDEPRFIKTIWGVGYKIEDEIYE